MKVFNVQAAVLSLATLGVLMTSPAIAELGRGNGNGNGNGNRPTAEPATVEVEDVLTEAAGAIILDIIYGNDEYADLISEELRLDILNDLDALPPGIQRQVQRGRGLPPGIAKKYQLPSAVIDALDLAPDTEILVIGRDIVVVNPADIVVDIITGLL